MVIKMEKQQKIKQIQQNLLKNSLYNSIKLIEELYKEIPDLPYKADFEQKRELFNYMIQYFATNITDPQRENVFFNLKKELLDLSDNYLEYIKSFQVSDYQNIYSKFNQKQNINSLIESFKSDKSKIDDLFIKIWLTNKFQTNTKISLLALFQNNEIDSYNKSVLVSALTLSLFRVFDENKFVILFDLYHEDILEYNTRALIGVIMSLIVHNSRLKLYPFIKEEVIKLNENPQSAKLVEYIFIQIIKSKETENLIKEFETDILPEMMKIQNDIKKELSKEERSVESFMDDENPGWENYFDSNPEFFEKMEEFTMRQFDGSDIFSATLGNLKNFTFFQKISSWFLPFYKDNQDIINFIGNAVEEETLYKFLETFEKATYFCNSDKYSFCMHLPDIAAPMRKNALGMLIAEIEGASDLISEQKTSPLYDLQKNNVTRYIQDLYRFYNFNKNFSGFQNIFKLDLTINKSEIFNTLENYLSILRSSAELSFSKKFYVESAEMFELITKINPDNVDIFEKAGFAYQKTEEYHKALDFYTKAEIFEHDKKWLNKKIAYCYLQLENIQKALEYYSKAEKEDTEDLSIQTFIGYCLLELNDYEKAIKHFFKIDFYKPDDAKTLRNIGICSLKLNKIEQAEKYLSKAVEKDPKPLDFIYLAIIHWIRNNFQDAILFFKTAINEYKTYKEFLKVFREQSYILIDNNISEFDIILLLNYLDKFSVEILS